MTIGWTHDCSPDDDNLIWIVGDGEDVRAMRFRWKFASRHQVGHRCSVPPRLAFASRNIEADRAGHRLGVPLTAALFFPTEVCGLLHRSVCPDRGRIQPTALLTNIPWHNCSSLILCSRRWWT